MIARFIAGMAIGAMVLVLLLAAFEADAAACCKFERVEPVKCWLLCRPPQK